MQTESIPKIDFVKVVFLDIDGVLIPRRPGSGPKEADPRCVAILNRIATDSETAIVVTSTWRLGLSPLELRAKLENWGVTGRILDKTPNLSGASRGHEIRAWLCERAQWRGDVTGMVILDDQDDIGNLRPWLARTNTEDGLTESEYEVAIALLSSPAESGLFET